MLGLADKDIKTAIIIISHMFKKLSDAWMFLKKIKHLELITIVSEMKNFSVWNEINDRLGTVEEIIVNLKA